MPYPLRLLPKSSDKILVNLNKDEILCRWVDADLVLVDESGGLSAEAIEEKQIFGYSTNKVPPSIPDDVRIDFHDKKFEEYWVEGADGLFPQTNDYFDGGGSYFLFRIGDINEFSEAYPYPADKTPNYKFKIKVCHKPLQANFSHFEFDFDFFELDGVKYSQQKPGKSSASRKIIAAEVRKRLIRISKFDLSQLQTRKAFMPRFANSFILFLINIMRNVKQFFLPTT